VGVCSRVIRTKDSVFRPILLGVTRVASFDYATLIPALPVYCTPSGIYARRQRVIGWSTPVDARIVCRLDPKRQGGGGIRPPVDPACFPSPARQGSAASRPPPAALDRRPYCRLRDISTP
jgi:hypothetical protein